MKPSIIEDDRKLCFVIMGFGKKTDFESGRTLDLDATYEAIIKPAAEGSGLRCIRADEIIHSGIIDLKMYEMLLRADLVIADISTNNVNAVYELGVRHALRPNSTIIMVEKEGKLYFDLNHESTFRYEHLGKDIGAREAKRAKDDLRSLINTTLAAKEPDSPVYTYLPKLQHPRLTDEEFGRFVDSAEAHERALAALIKEGETSSKASYHQDAVNAFSGALDMKPGEPYLIQQLALNTYKAKHPSVLAALRAALGIIAQLVPESSNDPETLGIAGAIHKRIWQETDSLGDLDQAIAFYRRGYEVRRDYYNGENLATCLVLRSKVQASQDEANYDTMTAKKVRESVDLLLQDIVKSNDLDERSDKKWIFATLANVNYGLGLRDKAANYERLFLEQKPAQWEIETFHEGKRFALGETPRRK